MATLEDNHLITAEQTNVRQKDGRKRNGNLLYTIRPIQEALEHFHARQMEALQRTTAIHNAKELASKKGIEFHPPDSEHKAHDCPVSPPEGRCVRPFGAGWSTKPQQEA